MTAAETAPGTDPGAPGAHKAVPIEGAVYEQRSQHPANLAAVGSYPVIGQCKDCYRRIRCGAKGHRWEHVADGDTSAGELERAC